MGLQVCSQPFVAQTPATTKAAHQNKFPRKPRIVGKGGGKGINEFTSKDAIDLENFFFVIVVCCGRRCE